jgi:hypothetical protein
VHSSVPLTPLWGNKGVRFDSLKFNWLGSLDRTDGMGIAWYTSSIKTWSDMLAREFTVAARARARRHLSGQLRVIAGYKDGIDVYLSPWNGARSRAAAGASSR